MRNNKPTIENVSGSGGEALSLPKLRIFEAALQTPDQRWSRGVESTALQDFVTFFIFLFFKTT